MLKLMPQKHFEGDLVENGRVFRLTELSNLVTQDCGDVANSVL